MDHKERMLNQLPYKSNLDGLLEDRLKNKRKIYDYNHTYPDDLEKLHEMIKDIVVAKGSIHIEPPFYCDYGYNIEVGDGFYANHNLVILDVGKVTIGKNCLFATNVSILTAGHPIHPDSRNSGYEYGIPIKIGDNVWLGGSVVVLPGVTIGNNVVIGAGSVVTKDIPDDVIAVGNPCKVIRKITEEDRKYYYKDRIFDLEGRVVILNETQ